MQEHIQRLRANAKPAPLVVGLACLVSAVGIFFFLPPTHPGIIAVWVLLVTIATYCLTAPFLRYRAGLIIAGGVAVFCTITIFIGFQVVSTFLLLLIILGLLKLSS